MGPDAMIFVFWMLSVKPTFSLSSFTFIKRLFSSSSLSALRVVSSALLKHYISCCPSCQLPWVPGAANSWNPSSCTTSTPDPRWGRPNSSRETTGANPNGQPTYRGGNKATIQTQRWWAKEEDPKHSHQLYKLQIKSTWSTRKTLCLWNIKKDIESSHRRKHTSFDSWGHWRQEHIGAGSE